MILKYTGDGKRIPHVPMRDLYAKDMTRLIEGRVFDSEEQAIELLTKRGIYSKPAKARKTKTPDIQIDEVSEDTD